jgi:LytS/YehU family sensor histidine kinase
VPISESDQPKKPISKIKIKLGNIELDFEGTEEYIRSDLPSLLELICTYSATASNVESDTEESEELPANPDLATQKVQMTTNTIAAKLNVKSGSDLVLAACAHLCLVKGVSMFERKNILAEMQTASNYYKQTHSSNLSTSLSTLVKGNKLIERSKDKYALTAQAKQELEATLV